MASAMTALSSRRYSSAGWQTHCIYHRIMKIDGSVLTHVSGGLGPRAPAYGYGRGGEAWETWGSRTPGKPPPPLGDWEHGVRFVHLNPPGPEAVVLSGPGFKPPPDIAKWNK